MKRVPPLAPVTEIETYEREGDAPGVYWLDIRFDPSQTIGKFPCGILVARVSRSKRSEN